MTPVRIANRQKIDQLDSNVAYAGHRFLDECEDKGYIVDITETYRYQERQNALYKIGRRGIVGEKPVTWTLFSDHTRGLAMDVYPRNCTHAQLEEIAEKYFIKHPYPIADPPHYTFVFVPLYQPFFTPSVDARIRALSRGIARVTGQAKILLAKQLERLRGRM